MSLCRAKSGPTLFRSFIGTMYLNENFLIFESVKAKEEDIEVCKTFNAVITGSELIITAAELSFVACELGGVFSNGVV